jgi:ATP-dependent HslUV protease ATP-binding subunit HslU
MAPEKPDHRILFTPGPTEVAPEILREMARPVIGHRGEEMQSILGDLLPRARQLFGAPAHEIFITASSATGLWEAAIRNCVARRVLVPVCGAFSERFLEVAVGCGVAADRLDFEWGRPVEPQAVHERLAGGKYDAVALVHNETSTGVVNPLAAVAEAVRQHPDVLLLLDVVSSLGGVPVEVARHGIDVALASVQKCLALPPGLALCAVSERAMARSRGQQGKGYYFDFVRLKGYFDRRMPMATPSVSHIFALQAQLRRIEAGGFEERYARHHAMAEVVRRDVDQIVRDLLEVGLGLVRDAKRKEVAAKAQLNAEERVIDALVGANAALSTRDAFRRKLRANELDDKEIEVQVADTPTIPAFEFPGMPGSQVGMINLSDVLGKAFGNRTKPRRVTVKDSFELLLGEESDKLIDNDSIVQEAIKNVENNGIVFLDEIDKICARSERIGADVSREGVQRDLLPLIEGTTVGTKYGPVKTDHILFIASGAFHIAKPSDLLPELQGRLPIRVELRALTREDFRRILTEPKACLIKQYVALMKTEGLELDFTADAIDAIADIAVAVNTSVENIGARRLMTVMERILDTISFDAADRAGEKLVIDAAYVEEHIGDLAKNTDLSKFIL